MTFPPRFASHAHRGHRLWRRRPQAVGRLALATVAALITGACATAPDATAPMTTPEVATPPDATAPAAAKSDFAGTVDIGGGRKMYLECAGSGSPTVILVSGQRGSGQEWRMTQSQAAPPEAPVFDQVAPTNRVCAYDRPGTPVGNSFSRSDPAPQPTTAGAAVADLHALLSAAGEAGPFVLVGHSFGGMVVRLYASTFPDEVQGLVLVDPPSEFLQDNETPEQWPIQRRLMEGDITEDLAIYPDIERVDNDATFDQLRAAPKLRPLPLVLLSADEQLGPLLPGMLAAGQVPSDVPADFGYVIDAAQAKAHAQLAQLVPGAVHITDTHSGHNIHLIQPQLVVDAIRQVVKQVAQQP